MRRNIIIMTLGAAMAVGQVALPFQVHFVDVHGEPLRTVAVDLAVDNQSAQHLWTNPAGVLSVTIDAGRQWGLTWGWTRRLPGLRTQHHHRYLPYGRRSDLDAREPSRFAEGSLVDAVA